MYKHIKMNSKNIFAYCPHSVFPYSLADENDVLTEERHSGVTAISNLHLSWELIIEYDVFLRLNLLGKAMMNKGTLLNILLN